MKKYNRILALLVFAMPLLATAAVPVYESNSAVAGGSSSTGYGNAGSYAGAGAAAPVSAQGQVFMQLQQLQQEVQQLRGLLEEQQNEIRMLKQEGLERYQDLDRRLSGGAAGSALNQNQSGGALNAGNTPVMPVSPVQNPAAASTEPADPEKEKLYYDAAFDLIKTRDFAKAGQAFNGFLRKYPNSQYAGNAQYWLGEVSLAQGDLPAAAQAFAQVGKSYPDHQKVPDSLYKLADVELRQGNSAQAKTLLQQVVSSYPGSSAAQLAQRDLKGM
jgi:tol-pal system protein YbgF